MRRCITLPLAAFLCAILGIRAFPAEEFRPPSVPLVVHDPYFSIWSSADRLTDVDPTHWTGKPHPLRSMVIVDGGAERIMGAHPADVHRMPQTGLDVLPTRTIYRFEGAGVAVRLTFTTPVLPGDLDVFSRPLSYISWHVQSTDGQPHSVQLAFEAGPELVVNTPEQSVTWGRFDVAGVDALRVGSVDQPVLERSGDDVRIDWGHAYVAVPAGSGASLFTASDAPSDGQMVLDAPPLAVRWDLGQVGEEPVTRWLMLAYDDEFSVLYFDEKLRPYWRRNGDDAAKLLQQGLRDYASLSKKCEEFDTALMADLEKAGGADYARLAALAYRQSLGACKLVADGKGEALYFSKENFSNGCMGTVDVFYPQAPILLALSPALMKATLVPILDYAASSRWSFPFAPHDIGRYPHANGQVYGGGEKSEENQMPVEESANMLILVAALARAEGSAEFAARYWLVLNKWAEYLKEKGFDPENQLCTDDFAGHLAHNVNLSAKAIVALGAFGGLAEQKGEPETAKAYKELARSFAVRWVKEADDGDHFRLAFDLPGTWSQKYNLVWDRILGLGLFPQEVFEKEMAHYKAVQNRYGLPLDNRSDYTKLDWVVWTACLTGDRDDFMALVAPVVRFLNETPDRVPMTDWYFTSEPKQRGFQARPVVGGVFVPLLMDAAMWGKWSK